mmetsp:Transcript_14952/g.22317  ORF Transcript_14952/g.22317 Transcript_14952/m.22317 type:complete len:158 (+) Transcript_14952:146-619(+)
MTKFILPFIAFACMLSAGSAHHTECDDLRTESECKKVRGCKWGVPNGAYPVGQLPRARCHGKSNERPDKDSLSDVYVRLDADYGYEDKGAESDNITPKDHLPAAENEYEEDELPNNSDVYVSSGIESSPPRKENLGAGESNRRWRLLPLDDQQQHKV